MKTITSNNRQWLFIEMPDTNSFGFHTQKVGETTFLCWQRKVGEKESFFGNCSIPLPSGHCIFHSTTTDITEEQAAEIVDEERLDIPVKSESFRNYVDGIHRCDIGITLGYSFAIDSFASLLQHHSITGRHAIIEII
jgi:hypothetical protein